MLLFGKNLISIWQKYIKILTILKLFVLFLIIKEKDELLGLVIEGGLNSFESDSTPIFVSSIEPKSCIEKTKYIRVLFLQKIYNKNY